MPGRVEAYRTAIEALYTTSYAVRALVKTELGRTQTKPRVSIEALRFDRLVEGLSVQTLHVGPYDDEGPTIAQLHEEVR